MKNISLLLNVVLLALVVYFGCNCNDKFFGGGKGSESAYCNDCDSYNPGEKYGMISYNTAKMLAQNYYNSDGKRFIFNDAERTTQEDARNIWFDLKVLKNFIALIESRACDLDCDTSKHLGIRIYYGKYPAEAELNNYADLKDVPARFALHHTLFMMPTYWDAAAGKHLDFDPLKMDANCEIKPFDQDLTPENAVADTKLASQSGNSAPTSVKQVAPHVDTPRQSGQVIAQNPKTYFILGGPASVSVRRAGSGGISEQQNHGDITPPPGGAPIYPTTPSTE